MIKGVNHVGISVGNLERALQFYRYLLGMKLVVEERFEGPQYDKILALRGVCGRVALLKAESFQLELFEFTRPVPSVGDPTRPVCDHGITHFCIEVDDVIKEYHRLKAAGVTFHCEPLDFAGAERATYGRDPDGNVFELLQFTSPVANT